MSIAEVGPRLAGARTAVRGRLATYFRERQAERGLLDADLLRAGASSHSANLSAYLSGRRFPDPRCFAELIDAFRNAGNGLLYMQIKTAELLYMEEAPAWDRFTSGQREWVSETSITPPTRSTRATRASQNGRS